MQAKNILVPVDFSPLSLRALDYALALAPGSGAIITVLHVTDPTDPATGTKEFTSPAHLMHLLETDGRLGRVRHHCIIEEGRAVDVILHLQEKLRCDLVVMGTHGAGTLKRKIFGTQTAAVISRAACPVLVVPEGAVFSNIGKVAVATDLSGGDLEAVQGALPLLAFHHPQLMFLLVQPGTGDAASGIFRMKEVSPQIRKYIGDDASAFYVSTHANLLDGIRAFANESKADLFMMVFHRRGMITTFLNPSQTLLAAKHPDVPLLAIPFR